MLDEHPDRHPDQVAPTDAPTAIARIRAGLPVTAIDAVLDAGWLTPTELDAIVLPRKTLANRRKLGILTPDQSDRLARVTRIIAIARETFGDDAKTRLWLRRPTTPLDGESPLHSLDTDHGIRRVETLLGRIVHGIAA